MPWGESITKTLCLLNGEKFDALRASICPLLLGDCGRVAAVGELSSLVFFFDLTIAPLARSLPVGERDDSLRSSCLTPLNPEVSLF